MYDGKWPDGLCNGTNSLSKSAFIAKFHRCIGIGDVRLRHCIHPVLLYHSKRKPRNRNDGHISNTCERHHVGNDPTERENQMESNNGISSYSVWGIPFKHEGFFGQKKEGL